MDINQILKFVEDVIEDTGTISLVIVDILQKLKAEEYNQKNNAARGLTDHCVEKLFAFTRTYHLPVLLLSAISRPYYERPITCASFKDSGNIESDTDNLWGLQQTLVETHEYKQNVDINFSHQLDEDIKSPIRDITLVCLKTRNGRQDYSIHFEFDTENCRFTELG